MLDSTVPRASSRGLIRILGVGFGLAVIVGSTLGIGILRTPGLVAGQLPSIPAILAVWMVGGLYTLVGAACIAELGTMLPEAGGYYVYARRAFGEGVGFGVGWTDWVTYCAVLGYVSITIGDFTPLLIPALKGQEKAIAILSLAIVSGLQMAGLRVSSRFQEIATAVKCAAFLVVVAGAIVFAPGSRDVVEVALPSSSFVGLIVALQSVVITYGGWQSALYFTEEDRNPDQNLPRSMIGGVVAVIVVYMLVNVALLILLPIGDLARSTLPAADAAQVVLGERGRIIITILSIVSLPPMLNAILMIGTRILFAMGRDRLLWSGAASVTAGGTPAAAMLATTAVALVLIATGTFQLRRLLPGAHRAAAAGARSDPAVPGVGISVVCGRGARRGRRVSRRRHCGRCDQRRRRIRPSSRRHAHPHGAHRVRRGTAWSASVLKSLDRPWAESTRAMRSGAHQ
jgi:APA family basic amino acid/polyamine antiporter